MNDINKKRLNSIYGMELDELIEALNLCKTWKFYDKPVTNIQDVSIYHDRIQLFLGDGRILTLPVRKEVK